MKKIDVKKMISSKFFQEKVAPKIVNVITGLIILIVAHFIGDYLRKSIFAYARRKYKLDDTKPTQQTNLAYRVAAHLSYYTVLVIGFLTVLKLFGIETASVIAIFGASGLAIGLAVQGTLTDLVSGLLIAIQQTINVGDLLKFDGHTARVIDFTLIHTTLQDTQTLAIMKVPNRQFQNNTFLNFTREKTGFANINISVSNSSKQQKTYEEIFSIIREAVKKHPHVQDEPIINVTDMSGLYTTVNVKVSIPTEYLPRIVADISSIIRIALQKNNVVLASYMETFVTK